MAPPIRRPAGPWVDPPSFVPEEEIQELRTLMRARKQIGRDRSSTLQRMHKILEDANIKLDAVITDLPGVSGRAMVEAMIKGETAPERLAALADRRLEALREALRGRLREHHRFMLRRVPGPDRRPGQGAGAHRSAGRHDAGATG